MTRLAIIGTGIAGMASAYHLKDRSELILYERNSYAGGHTNTVDVIEDGRVIPIDTGFIVFNEVTYPELIRLFKALDVPIKPAPMSFSVSHRPTGLEFCGSGVNGLFAQRRNLLRPRFWMLLAAIHRFNREAPRALEDPRLSSLTLAEYASAMNFPRDLLDHYLIPMSSAVWSTEPDAMLSFPAAALIRFFKNHGFLGLHTQHPWLTVDGGSRQYRDRLIARFRDRIRLSTPAVRVRRSPQGVVVRDAGGGEAVFDRVILACHADEALAMLEEPTDLERRALSAFRYQRNAATLHTDESVMPRTRACWSSWNYRVDRDRASTVYWMNRLQGVSRTHDYFVSINDPGLIAPSKVLRRIEYDHPVFTVEAMAMQKELPRLNDTGPIFFCGSYFRYGFHEDALISALDVVRRLS